ncbi:MAG: hypothetical protein CVU11_01165 [Bacteroidetes bacterium HGW-Bacteroidetes-6]|jgi:hypothetical protein|nr:MAG: hypothetical protein CVU11_01165 [Bacteroidetes bacterium HGW-Bacteroidetes-6]
MKSFALVFCLFSFVAMSQNEISMNTGNGNESGIQTNVYKPANNNPVNIQEGNPQIQSANTEQANYNEVQQQGNVVQQQQNLQRNTVNQTVSRNSGSSSSFSTGTRKKAGVFKAVSKTVQVFQYKHKGRKKFHHHKSRPKRKHVLRCF